MVEFCLHALVQALEDAQGVDEPVEALATAVVNGEAIETEIIEEEATGHELVIKVEPGSAEAAAHPENDPPARKPAPKGRSRKGAAATDDMGK